MPSFPKTFLKTLDFFCCVSRFLSGVVSIPKVRFFFFPTERSPADSLAWLVFHSGALVFASKVFSKWSFMGIQQPGSSVDFPPVDSNFQSFHPVDFLLSCINLPSSFSPIKGFLDPLFVQVPFFSWSTSLSPRPS